MAEPQRPLWLLAILLAAWALAFAWSGFAGLTTQPDGDGFARGLNRVGLFLGWQGVAGLIALAAFAVGRGWPKGSGIRRVSAVPFWFALALLAALAGLVVWARLQG